MSDHTVTTSITLPLPQSPLREVWTIAWPTVLAMTSQTVMQFVDKMMVGWVSPTALAAQTSGGIWSFSLLAFALGVVTVVNTFVSQNLGAGTPRNGPKYAWASFWIGVGVWALILLPYSAALPWIFRDVMPMLSPTVTEVSPELLRWETHYAQILVAGSIFMLVGRGLNQFFFGMHRPHIVTVGALAGNATNVVCNYVLIFGEHGVPQFGLPGVPGVPAMGIYGAAIATIFGSLIELAIPGVTFLGRKLNAEFATRAAWRPDVRAIGEVIRLGWPAAVQWGNELVCWAIFMTVLVGSFGEDQLAACSIAFGYMGLSFMPAVGFSVATNSLVGKFIGAGMPDVAVARARLTLALAMTYMTVCALVFFFFRHPLIELFLGADIDPARAARIIDIGGQLMICTAVFQTFDAFGIIYSGALRGAGDTVWPGVITVIYSWALIVGGGYAIARLFPQLDALGPWIASGLYIILYGLTMWWRFASGKWRSIDLLKRDAATLAATSVDPPGEQIAGAAMAGAPPAQPELIESLAEPMAEPNMSKR